MRAYCAAVASRLGELMGTASTQDVEIRQDALTPSDAAHSTNLNYILSLLTDGEALDIVQNSPVSNGLEVWRRMVTRWEPKVPSRFRWMLQAILFPKWDIPDWDVTQLLRTAERRQDLRCNQTGVVLHHLPDASLREHQLLNSRVYGTEGSSSTNSSHGKDDLVRQKANGKGKKGKKGRKGQGKGTKPEDGDTKQKGACHNCAEVGHFARECPKKKKSKQCKLKWWRWCTLLDVLGDQSHWTMMLAEVCQNQEQSNNIEFGVDSGAARHAWPCKTKTGSSHRGTFFDCHRSASCITGYAGCVISIGGRARCGNQCESHIRIASCPPSNPECAVVVGATAGGSLLLLQYWTRVIVKKMETTGAGRLPATASQRWTRPESAGPRLDMARQARTRPVTAGHGGTRPDTVGHGPTSPDTARHGRTRPGTTGDGRTRPDTVGHGRTRPDSACPRPDTAGQARTRPDTAGRARHGRIRLDTAGHGRTDRIQSRDVHRSESGKLFCFFSEDYKKKLYLENKNWLAT